MMTEASSVGSIDNLMSDLEELIKFSDDSDIDADVEGNSSSAAAHVDGDADSAPRNNASIRFETESFLSASDQQIDIDIVQARSAEGRIESLRNASCWGEVAPASSFASDVVATDGAISENAPASPARAEAPQDKNDDEDGEYGEYESFAIDNGVNASFVSDEDEEEEEEEEEDNNNDYVQHQTDEPEEQEHQQDQDQDQEHNNQNGEKSEHEYDDGIDFAPTESVVRPRLGRWFGRRSQSEPKAATAPSTTINVSPDIHDDDDENNNESATPSSMRGLGRYARQVSDSIRNLREAAATLDHMEASKLRAREEAMDPYSIITSPHCKARTLSISDHHATILLIRTIPKRQRSRRSGHSTTTDDDDDDERLGEEEERRSDTRNGNDGEQIARALLKLTVAPFHKVPLGKKPLSAGDYADQEFSTEDMEASSETISFLSRYRFNLTSNSGSEYSYYDAVPSQVATTGQRVAGEVGLAQSLNMALHGLAGEPSTAREAASGTIDGVGLSELMLGGFKVELIAPASDQQIRLEMPKPSESLVKETPELYNTVTKPYVETIVSGDSLDWIEDIVQGRTSTNGVLFENEDYFLHIDTMWKSHPDPRTTPTEDWFEHHSTSDLHIIGMLKLSSVASLRDLRGEHVPLLRSMLADGLRIIHELYGVDSDQVRVYVPYPPQSSIYRFHIYYTRIDNTEGCLVESAHLVHDVIQNLEMDSDYYTKERYSTRYAPPMTSTKEFG